MKLLTYMKTLSPIERADFAKRCETSVGHLLNIAYGYKEASAHLAMAIEEESGRSVMAESVTPSARWHVVRNQPKRARRGQDAA